MIFLANNEIKALPLEFFKLSNLAVLSLRALSSSFLLFTLCTDSLRIGNNSLEYLPPEIAELYALKDLDVVNNNLRFLPAEMTTMTLTNLNVHTNPWYPDPAKPATRDMPEAMDGATRVHFRVPPLREVVLRYLLTPSTNQQRFLAPTPAVTAAPAQQATTLEDRFQLPLQDGTLTPADAALFARLAPAAVSAPRRHAFSRSTTSGVSAGMFLPPTTTLLSKSEPAECSFSSRDGTTDAAAREQHEHQKGFGRCPSPRHFSGATHATTTWARLGPPFVMPAEERYTWAMELASVRVGETTGGVPLLWRGCGRGCLSFLDRVSTNAPAAAGVQREESEKDRRAGDGGEGVRTEA